MSAAEPVHPAPVVNRNGDAAVIDITKRGAASRTAKGGGRVQHTASDTHRPSGNGRPPRQLAEVFERQFNERNLSLTDPKVGATFTLTVEIAARLLIGAHVEGTLNDEQAERVDTLLRNIRLAPAVIAEE